MKGFPRTDISYVPTAAFCRQYPDEVAEQERKIATPTWQVLRNMEPAPPVMQVVTKAPTPERAKTQETLPVLAEVVPAAEDDSKPQAIEGRVSPGGTSMEVTVTAEQIEQLLRGGVEVKSQPETEKNNARQMQTEDMIALAVGAVCGLVFFFGLYRGIQEITNWING